VVQASRTHSTRVSRSTQALPAGQVVLAHVCLMSRHWATSGQLLVGGTAVIELTVLGQQSEPPPAHTQSGRTSVVLAQLGSSTNAHRPGHVSHGLAGQEREHGQVALLEAQKRIEAPALLPSQQVVTRSASGQAHDWLLSHEVRIPSGQAHVGSTVPATSGALESVAQHSPFTETAHESETHEGRAVQTPSSVMVRWLSQVVPAGQRTVLQGSGGHTLLHFQPQLPSP
jgi:hypothetical protein